MTTWTDFIFECICWPFQRFQRHVLAWVLAIVVTLSLIQSSLQDTVNGHATCDFAGQWLMGRTFYREIGPELYTVDSGKRILAEGYQDKVLEGQINDILKKGYQKDLYEKGIGGALYPPTASILFSLLAQFNPVVAHTLAVIAYLLMCYGSGWMISRITRQRLQWGEATLLILFFPNNFMGLMLGQNQALTLFILTAGWYCKHRGWPFVAGLVWGLFAYKPVFAVALLLVPIALRSPRWFLGMALSGLLCVAGTLPYFGIEPWFRWFQVGRHAEQLYQVDRNWIWMSRDLVGLPRRKMWDADSMENVLRYNIGVWQPGGTWYMESEDGTQKYFHPMVWLFWGDAFVWEKHQNVYVDTDPAGQFISPWYLTLIGYILLAGVAGITVLISWRCQLNAADIDGAPAAFLLTGSLLCVLHFMHYDLLSFALPVLIALSMLSRWPIGRRVLFVVWYLIWLSRTYAFFFGSAILEIPWETFLLLILWAWMGVVTLKANGDSLVPDV